VTGEVLLLVGCVLTLISAIGMARFRDVFARMHALTKASTLGVVFALAGAAVHLSHPNDVTSLVLAAALQVLTSPVAANVLSLATYSAVIADAEHGDDAEGLRDVLEG
jgi:multicomponent Na+:H+ antiporter subunit G